MPSHCLPPFALQVYAGHVHAYERTAGGVYKYQRDACGPQYTLIGAPQRLPCTGERGP